MTVYTKTGQELLSGLSEFLDDDFTGTTSAAGNVGGTTLIDASLEGEFGLDGMRGGWIKITSGTNDGEVRRVLSNDGISTVTVAEAFTATVATSVTYEFHRWRPSLKLDALDTARFIAFPHVSTVVEDAGVVTDGYERRFPFSSSIQTGPYSVWMEQELGTSYSWNLLANPDLDTLTGWTEDGLTASLYAKSVTDRLIPKYNQNCTKLAVPATTACSYDASLASGVTAADFAGRRVMFGTWLYAEVASRVTVKITDDAGSSSSGTHEGRGWEYLSVEHVVDGDNATTLTPSIEVSSGAVMTIFANHSWLVFGRIPDQFPFQIPHQRVQSDGSSQTVFLEEIYPEGTNLKLVGRGLVSALSGSLTATMEVDDGMAEILYGHAARICLERTGFTSDDSPELQGKIATALQRTRDIQPDFNAELAKPPGMISPHFAG